MGLLNFLLSLGVDPKGGNSSSPTPGGRRKGAPGGRQPADSPLPKMRGGSGQGDIGGLPTGDGRLPPNAPGPRASDNPLVTPRGGQPGNPPTNGGPNAGGPKIPSGPSGRPGAEPPPSAPGGNGQQPPPGPNGQDQPPAPPTPPGPNDPNGPNGPTPPKGEADFLKDLQGNFGKYDKDGNGFIDKDELKQGDLAKNESAQNMSKNMDKLMFANIDPSAAAWNGLSKNDVDKIAYRNANGESMDKMSGDLQNETIRSRGLGDAAGFDRHVKDNQSRAQSTPAAYDNPGLGRPRPNSGGGGSNSGSGGTGVRPGSAPAPRPDNKPAPRPGGNDAANPGGRRGPTPAGGEIPKD